MICVGRTLATGNKKAKVGLEGDASTTHKRKRDTRAIQKRLGVDEPLPDVFSGCVFRFDDKIEVNERKELARHVLAFNGYGICSCHYGMIVVYPPSMVVDDLHRYPPKCLKVALNMHYLYNLQHAER